MSTRHDISRSVAAPAVLAAVCIAVASAAAAAQFGGELPIATGGTVTGLASGDLDGDGDRDVVVARMTGPVVLGWHANLGGGAFGPVQPVGTQPDSAEAALTMDADHDGDVDILSVLDFYTPELGQDHQILLFRNAGNGTFTSQTLAYLGIDSLSAMALGDLEGDGDEDLFHGVWGDATLFVQKNTPTGFDGMQLPISGNATGTRDIRPADLDGDGDADLVVTSSFLEEVYLFENLDGTEAFGHKEMIDGDVPGAGAVDAADLDGDDDLDLLVTAATGSGTEVRWYRNLGAGTFDGAQTISDVGLPGADVLGVDIEGDGDVDVLTANWTGPAWHPNDGAGQFGPPQVLSSGSLALALVDAPDLSGDGVPDVLFGTSVGGKVAWHEGLSPALWTDLGFALEGSAGLPSLAGTGPLSAGSSGSLKLASAAPSAPCGLFLSLAGTSAPFKCGTLVPVPVTSSLVLATGATGSVELPWASWPAGLTGLGLYLQVAIQDAGAVCGVALSNALRADPP